jgi:hypothetical protein
MVASNPNAVGIDDVFVLGMSRGGCVACIMTYTAVIFFFRFFSLYEKTKHYWSVAERCITATTNSMYNTTIGRD